MRLAIDGSVLRGQPTGIGQYTRELLRRLPVAPGDEIGVYAYRAIDHPEELEARGLRVHVVPARRRLAWLAWTLPNRLRRDRPDLCHFVNYFVPPRCPAPYLVSIYDLTAWTNPGWHSPRQAILTRFALPSIAKRARLILTVSDYSKGEIVRLLGADAGRVRVIHGAAGAEFQPVSTEEAARFRRSRGLPERCLLMLGTLEPRKNLPRVLAAYRLARAAGLDARLVIAGKPGWGGGGLSRALHAAGPDVTWLGYVPDDQRRLLYGSARAVLYPSLSEGFGLPPLEAMACGTPVVASPAGSLEEVVGEAALRIDPMNLQEMAEAMRRINGDEELRADLTRRGLARAATFSWEHSAEALAAAYREAMPSSRVLRTTSRVTPEVLSVVGAGLAPARSVESAILKTLTYSDLFDYPLTREELCNGLFDMPGDPADIVHAISLLRVSHRIEETDGYVHLPGRSSLVALRMERSRNTRALLDRYGAWISRIGRFPGVAGVALSGACAFDNVTDGDIDLFILTRPGRTWLTYAALLLVKKLFGVHQPLCLNYFLEESSPILPERDPFTAHQIANMKVLSGDETFARFFDANAWYRDFLPNAVPVRVRAGLAPARCAPARSSVFWRLLDTLIRIPLSFYLRLRVRNHPEAFLALEPTRIKLHGKSRLAPTLAALNRRLERAA